MAGDAGLAWSDADQKNGRTLPWISLISLEALAGKVDFSQKEDEKENSICRVS
ncbi:MAG: hypothetical protein P8130_07935 [Deltaproteobacteria bacterium]|jgi:hypothetical protein